MKYYYLIHNGSCRANVNRDKDFDRINRDRNKIVITRINGIFHVLVCKNGTYEQEKKVYSYLDLVKYLRKVTFNIYFVNVSYETVYLINTLIRSDEEIDSKEVITDKKEEIYTIGDGNIFKFEAYISRDILKKSICTLYGQEISNDNYHEIPLADFASNSELFEIYQIPFIERNGRFLVPNYSYSQPKLFYMLSGICAKNGELINLSNDDLINLCMMSSVENEIAKEILSNVEIRVLEQKPLSAVDQVVDYLDIHHQGEKANKTRLVTLKDCVEVAKSNRIIFDVIKSIKSREKKEEQGKVLVNTQ